MARRPKRFYGACLMSPVSMASLLLCPAKAPPAKARINTRSRIDWAVFLTLMAWTGTVTAVSLGEAIFDTGAGRDGRGISGRIGAAQLHLNGAAVACAGCHGADGAGGGESFVRAPDIRWFNLSKPYGDRRVGGQVRPAYDARLLARAVRSGLASDGRRLDPVMPRFDLADDEIEALLDHLRQLSGRANAPAPILASDLASFPSWIIPLPRRSPASVEALYQGLAQCARSVGQAPPRVMRYDDPLDGEARLRDLANRGRPPILFASFVPGWELRYLELTRTLQLTTVLPLFDTQPNHQDAVYYRLPDSIAQSIALALTLARKDRLVVWFDEAFENSRKSADGLAHWALAAKLQLRFVTERPTGASRVLVLRSPEVSDWAAFVATGASQILMPARYFDPAKLERSGARGALDIALAFPYPPRYGASGQWIKRSRAWLAIGCALLEEPMLQAALQAPAAVRAPLPDLRLGNWTTITAHTDPQNAAEHVTVMAW